MEMKIKLQPFSVPNYVLSESSPRPRQEGFKEVPKWEISELDSQTLSDLCDQFRRDVFKKSGKDDPKGDE